MSRKIARERMYQLLFGEKFLNNESQWEMTLNEMLERKEWEIDDDDLFYIRKECAGIVEKYNEIKTIISDCLKGYTFEQVYQSDKIALLIAVYELKYTDIDAKIAINEAVELAKKYGIEKSSKFVNGVLSGVIKNNE